MIWFVLFNLTFAIAFSSCVSRTVPDQRFGDSSVLPAPALSSGPNDAENFTFAFVGDLHVGTDPSRMRRILDTARAEGDGLVILLGDTVDQGTRESYSLVRTSLTDYGFGTLALPVIGNHEIFEDGWTHYKELMGPSHYTVDYGNSRFIALDTADSTVDRTQFEWLEGELKRSRPRNTFILSHYMPVIPGQRTYLKLSNEEESLRLMRLAQNYSVRAWLGGHYHSYASQTLSGVQYVVAGGGGGRRMEPVKDYFFVQGRVTGESVTYTLRTVE